MSVCHMILMQQASAGKDSLCKSSDDSNAGSVAAATLAAAYAPMISMEHAQQHNEQYPTASAAAFVE